MGKSQDLYKKAKKIIQSIQVNAREVTTSMLPNRELLARIQRYGLQKI